MFECLSHLCSLLFTALQKMMLTKSLLSKWMMEEDDKNVFKTMILLNTLALTCRF